MKQTIILNAEDNVAGGTAKPIESAVHKLERLPEGRVAGGVGRKVLPSKRQRPHQFRNGVKPSIFGFFHAV